MLRYTVVFSAPDKRLLLKNAKRLPEHNLIHLITVNSEISRGFYFRETSHMRSFVKIKSSRNGEITLSFINIA